MRDSAECSQFQLLSHMSHCCARIQETYCACGHPGSVTSCGDLFKSVAIMTSLGAVWECTERGRKNIAMRPFSACVQTGSEGSSKDRAQISGFRIPLPTHSAGYRRTIWYNNSRGLPQPLTWMLQKWIIWKHDHFLPYPLQFTTQYQTLHSPRTWLMSLGGLFIQGSSGYGTSKPAASDKPCDTLGLPAQAKIFLCQSLQAGSSVHPTSYAMSTDSSFTGYEATETWNW